ncbi:APC family permease [uncultured Amnibacterium sp.]|uniref:APC family permease n=1 Tax=uncultured Amnibacterium sp. TaxID=1631851 RepID=UPI0035CB116D
MSNETPAKTSPSAESRAAGLSGPATVNIPVAPADLPRRLGVPALVLIVVAFNAPIATMAGFAQLSVGFGSGVGAPIAFLIAGLILLVFSVGFVAMSRYIRNPGAFYRFIVAGIGRAPGLAGAFVATAAYILLEAGSFPYMGLIMVDLMKRLTGGEVFSWQIWAVVFVAIVTILGLLRVDLSIKVLGTLVCVEVVVVALWEAVVFAKGGPGGYSTESFTPTAFLSGNPGVGVLFAMLCMIGIETAACFRSETKNPEKAVGRATYISIAFMAVFYALGVWAYIITQGPTKVVNAALTDPVGSFFSSVDGYLGGFFLKLTALILVTSQLAAINSIQGAASRYLYALGRDRVLSPKLALVHRRLESPWVAVLAVNGACLVVLALIFVFRLDGVASYAALSGSGIFFLLPLLIATSLGVVMFYRRHRDLRPGVWSSVVAPSLAFISLLVLFVLTALNLKVLVGSDGAAIGADIVLAVVAFGGFFLAMRYRRSRPAVYASIGEQ